MNRTDKCAKCGCTEIVHRAMVVHADQRSWESNVVLRVDGDPTAMFSKGTARSLLHGEVCSACGYIAFFAESTAELLAAFNQAQES